PPGRGEDAALHVDRVRARRVAQAAELGGILDHAVDGDDRAGAAGAEAGALPQDRALLVHDARRVDHRADRVPVQAARHTEGDDLAGRDAAARADADAGGRVACPPGGTLLGAGGAGGDHPVSVQAMLRTVSFTLEVAAYAADGSNPEWIPQCSQRG